MTEFKVGLLALSSVLAVVFMSFQITRNQAGFGEFKVYKSVIDDASGIYPKTTIKIAGINSGRIKNIELFGRRALLVYELKSEIKVTEGTALKIKSVGFLGDKYIDIILGEEDKPSLPAGSMIPSDTGGGLESLTSDASEALTDLKAILKSLRKSLAPIDGKSPMLEIVNNLNQSMENLKVITADVKGFIKENQDKLTNTVENFEDFSGSLADEFDSQNSESLLAKAKGIEPIIENARLATEDMKLIMADIKAGKGTVGKLLKDEETVDRVNTALAGVQRMVNRFNSIRSELAMFTHANSEGNNYSQLNLSIYPSPERFYRLGIVTTEIGVESETIIKTEENGVENQVTRKEVDKNSFTFNAQIGRELQNWRIRVGLIESSGGIGVDYLLRSWDSIFTLEVFDYRERLGPNVRFLAQIHLWNVVYGVIGGEDLISRADEQSFTIGAGLKFTDEDLRGLIGLFI